MGQPRASTDQHPRRPGDAGHLLGAALATADRYDFEHVDHARHFATGSGGKRRWRISVEVAQGAIGPVLVSLTITAVSSSASEGGVDADVLRGLSVSKIRSEALRHRDAVMREAYERLVDRPQAWTPAEQPHRAGRRSRTPERLEHLTALAEAYLELQGSPGLKERLAERFASHGTPLPLTTVHEDIKAAAAEELLTSPGRGIRVREAGPRLREIRRQRGQVT